MTIEQANFWGSAIPIIFFVLGFLWFAQGWKKDAQRRAQEERDHRWKRAEEQAAWDRDEREYQRRRSLSPTERVADDVALAKRIRRERERTERRIERALLYGKAN